MFSRRANVHDPYKTCVSLEFWPLGRLAPTNNVSKRAAPYRRRHLLVVVVVAGGVLAMNPTRTAIQTSCLWLTVKQLVQATSTCLDLDVLSNRNKGLQQQASKSLELRSPQPSVRNTKNPQPTPTGEPHSPPKRFFRYPVPATGSRSSSLVRVYSEAEAQQLQDSFERT